MEIKNFLQSRSKEELISLIEELFIEHDSVREFLNKEISENQKKYVQKNHVSVEEQNTAAGESSEQPFTQSLPLITRLSSPQEKINLYKTLFRGRQDVFALRWFNAKTNKSGYSPVCANKWAVGKCDLKKFSCATCPYKSPVALEDKYIFNHLAGRDEFCRDVIGLYPLIEGNLCYFLAMDFDAHSVMEKNPAWKGDILAVHKIFADFGIPSYIEVSRSGNGGHLWIFFENAIPARLARNLGTVMLKAAMQNRHSIPFESFDRLFPNQDEIPSGGYGNLIALPLQGRAVKEEHTVFVDGAFKPYEDRGNF